MTDLQDLRRRSVGYARRRPHLLALTIIVIAGVVVRVAYWGVPMRYDEALSFFDYAMAPVKGITLTYNMPNNQILNSLFMHFEWDLFGVTRYGLRLHVLLAGIVSPAVAYWVARQLYGTAGGLWAAALVATSSQLVDFSVNARGYELGALFVLICLGVGTRLIRTGGRCWARLFILTAGLAMWSVPTMGYALAAIGLWMVASVALTRPLDRGRLLQVLGTLGLAALVGYVLYWPLIAQPGWNYVPPLPHTWGAIHPLLSLGWTYWNRTTVHPLDWLIAVAFFGALGLSRFGSRLGMRIHEPVPLPAAVLITLLGILLVGSLSPFVRSYIGFLPLYLVSAAGGLAGAGHLAARRFPRRAGALAPVGAVALALGLSVSVLNGDQLVSEEPPGSDNNIVSILEHTPAPGDQVLIYPSYDAGVGFYLYKTGTQRLVTQAITPAQRAAGHVFVIVPRGSLSIPIAESNVEGVGGRPVPGQVPRLVKQMHYICIYDVPIRS